MYHVKVVLHGEEVDEGGHDLLDGESSEGVLIAHDQHLAHFDDRRELNGFVGARQTGEQLLHLGGGAAPGGAAAAHAAVQQVLHAGSQRPEQVWRQTPRLQQRLQTPHLVVRNNIP
jgi:hypothetical protein